MSESSNTAFSITVVGSGVSTAIPVIGHFDDGCACADAMANPNGPNARNNVSLLISVPDQSKSSADAVNCGTEAGMRHVLIDCGKTFRNAYFRVLAPRGLRFIDALLITHDHADAMQGLDDIRDIQDMEMQGDDWHIKQYMPTYMSDKTLKIMSSQVGYIVRNSHIRGPAPRTCDSEATESAVSLKDNNIGPRRAAALDLFTLPDDAPSQFYVPALGPQFPMYSVPVEHGAGYMCLGFVFGPGVAFKSNGHTSADGACIVYLSDCSAVPPAAMTFLKDLVRIDVLLIDILYGPGKRHATHFCMDDAVQLTKELQPTHMYGVGMYCDIEHVSANAYLQKVMEDGRADGSITPKVESMQLAYDGMHLGF